MAAVGRLTPRASALIRELELVPHPEGGHYRELFRSERRVVARERGVERAALTTIAFLLADGEVSRWHRVLSDEVWHYHEGAPLELSVRDGEGPVVRVRVGPVDGDQRPVRVVPAGWWQSARTLGDYTLVGCDVAPGFEFADFTIR